MVLVLVPIPGIVLVLVQYHYCWYSTGNTANLLALLLETRQQVYDQQRRMMMV
jgi:hypothetical protein